MKNPNNPIIPPGSVLEHKNQGRARVRLAVFFVLAVHVVGLLGLLMVGCRKPATEENPADAATNSSPMINETSTNVMIEPTNMPVANNPPPVNPTAVTQMGTPTDYVVVAGDNFTTIAKKFGVSVKAIQEANPTVDPKKLQVRQKLVIPPPAPVTTTTVPPGSLEMNSTGEQTYTVKSGDTLTKIASDFHTTVKVIRSANNLSTDKIIVGQKLKIPKAPGPETPAAPASPAM